MELLSAAEARRVSLAAHGLTGRRVAATRTSLRAMVHRLRVLQLDSVNVFERSHYLPAFSRLGSYDKGVLDAVAASDLTEAWAHEATLIPVEDVPLFAFRRRAMRRRYGDGVHAGHPELRQWILDQIGERGPLRARDLQHEENRRSGPWWGLSLVKQLLEYMFLFGELATAPRVGFERCYALPEQVWPNEVIDVEVPDSDAHRELVRRAAIALGVATADDLADYFRLHSSQVAPAIAELEESGELVPVRVQGWERSGRPLRAWRHRDATAPARVGRDAILTPFDPVVWYRPRAERLHDFHYRIEIYTPAAKRQFGYYCLPVMLGGRLAGRVDLKNDRQQKVLRVQAAWTEPRAPRDAPERVASLLREAARWQGCEGFVVQDRGNLAPALMAELGR
ncbi:winged helix-turn-helix domain-containing protein [Arachnia propionica]|uniref:Winged helix-turn-helix domain-containing protein n=1 Tax=Arachnia propionica TaxID=1750 RepID=A0A3P1WUT1_9ACTN|nr:crosslink repair DNA glycosylase YcaQ family protein [Arachnia propionica]RRD50342.1 winged helix-turn-helix domain-containing protein [Arachnia propionica]